MGLFHKKATNVVTEEPEQKEELSPFEKSEQQVVDLYSDFDNEQLFTIHLVFENGAEYDLSHQTKKNVGWIVAHKNSDTEGIFQYAVKDGLGIGIDLRKVIILTVKPEETSKDEEDAA
ncbi:hypothetical protein QUW45_08200 [Limosilactobacillus pontis]|uniref:hypothetical protein n=1 Tax=Limosilactobacillus pontis TaxID=35787 RepID=UPI0025A3FDC0|nr:hypothetical protein [Limosilactobacillus pontis]MDM8332643.1 hypothetical protein [Limosilactobacillus pontis]